MLEQLSPLADLLAGLLARQERLETEISELRAALQPPRVMRAKDFCRWYRDELRFPAERYPISYDTLIRWWDDREVNGAALWGTQAEKGAALWVDAHALLRWVAAGHHDGRRYTRRSR